jgi:hypothetical protein
MQVVFEPSRLNEGNIIKTAIALHLNIIRGNLITASLY